jgi:hypothetical protein
VWERLRLGLAVRGGAHLDLDGVMALRGHEVVVTGTAAWNDDGELRDPEHRRTLAVDPHAWQVIL